MARPIWNSSRAHSIEIIGRDKSRYSYQPYVAISSRKTHPPARRQESDIKSFANPGEQKHEQTAYL